MAVVADVAFLDKALADLETARKWTPRTISKLEALINSDDPWAVYRMDPVRFAAARGMPEQEAIDLFLHATHLGLFDMEWRLLCPVCSLTVSSCRAMNMVRSKAYCSLCQMDAEANLDDFIAVSFNLNPRVRELPWHKPETLSAADLLLRYQIDPHAAYEGMGKMTELLMQFSVMLERLEPGASRTLEMQVPEGMVLVGFDAALNRSFSFAPEGPPATAPQKVEAVIERGDWTVSAKSIAPGPVSLTVRNGSNSSAPLAVYVRPNGEGPPLALGEFLNGNRLLSNQTFRNLFRAETLATGEGVGVRDVTLLFTDLKGSTELYERVGDLAAFALVQQHFEHLRRAVQEQEGAVIKTIGDAVMASFVKPEQAVRAALAMFREIEDFNRTRGKRDLIIKVGMHRGHSIAVTLNERLDYFGQTVNLAARVQGVSNADEICMTEDVYKIPEVQAALNGMNAVAETSRLKGIQGDVPIRRVRVK